MRSGPRRTSYGYSEWRYHRGSCGAVGEPCKIPSRVITPAGHIVIDNVDLPDVRRAKSQKFELIFVDGNHDYEFALFDIQCGMTFSCAGGSRQLNQQMLLSRRENKQFSCPLSTSGDRRREWNPKTSGADRCTATAATWVPQQKGARPRAF